MSQGDARVLSPQSSRDELKDEIRVRGIDMVGVIDACKIANGIYSTGEMGTIIKEQPLIIRTGDGLITLTGCAHPGIVEIVSKAVGSLCLRRISPVTRRQNGDAINRMRSARLRSAAYHTL